MSTEHFELLHKALNILDKFNELCGLVGSLSEDESKYILKLLEEWNNDT